MKIYALPILLFFIACSSVTKKTEEITLPQFTPYGSAEDQIVLLTYIEGKVIKKGSCIYLRSRSSGPSANYLLIWDSTKNISSQRTSSGLEILSSHNMSKAEPDVIRLGDRLQISGTSFKLSDLSPSLQHRFRLLPYKSWDELGRICDTTYFKTVSEYQKTTGK